MKKILVFDFDGTIADSFPEFTKIVNKLAEKYSFKKVTNEDIPRLRDYDTLRLLQELKIPLWKVPFITKDGRSELQKIIERVQPITGIKEQLKKLHKTGCILGILTSNSERNVIKFLEKNDMQVFDFIYTGSSLFGKDKIIKSMLREKRFEPGDVLYVGDETRDIESAKKAKIKVVAVTWGFTSRKGLEKYKPDFLIDQPEELLKVVKTG
jgi:phosphoglycolate phosphatase